MDDLPREASTAGVAKTSLLGNAQKADVARSDLYIRVSEFIKIKSQHQRDFQ